MQSSSKSYIIALEISKIASDVAVAVVGDSRRFRPQSPFSFSHFSATVAVFCDSVDICVIVYAYWKSKRLCCSQVRRRSRLANNTTSTATRRSDSSLYNQSTTNRSNGVCAYIVDENGNYIAKMGDCSRTLLPGTAFTVAVFDNRTRHCARGFRRRRPFGIIVQFQSFHNIGI